MGLRPIPVDPHTKRPLIAWQPFQQRSPGEDEIRAWWTRWPHAAVGVLCGIPGEDHPGLLAIDVDLLPDPETGEPKSRPNPWPGDPEKPLPAGCVLQTPSGGKQYLMRAFDGAKPSAGKLAPGVDVRARGSYTVIYGPGRKFLLGDLKEALQTEAPPWLRKAILATSRPSSPAPAKAEVIPVGSRNTRLTSIAGSLRRQGMGFEEIRDTLLKINATRCDPPLPEREVIAIAKSVARYPAGPELPRLTDVGNAELFVKEHGHEVRFCYPWGRWFVWDGRRWAPDTQGRVELLAKQTIRRLYMAALDYEPEIREKIAKHALQSEKAPRIRALLEMARSEPGIPVLPEQLDRDPWLLNVLNGTLNLRTGELRKHRKQDLITKLAPVEFDPEATAPLWEAFLERVIPDPEVREFLQRAVGYSLTGDTSEQCLLLLYGTGQNGKSTFLETVRSLLGDYAQHTDFETFLAQRHKEIRNDIARLAGARFVTALEVEAGKKLAESLIKLLTGGDTVTARFLYSEFFEFKPTFKLFLACNHKPVIRGTDLAIWRRIRLVPFTVTIPEEEQDPHLADKLKQELPGILNWALEGCLAWQRDGLRPPTQVLEATKSYREEMDILGEFLAVCCKESVGARISSTLLYQEYLSWCERENEHPISRKTFMMRLRERGFDVVRSHGRRFFVGLTLRQEGAEGDLFVENPRDKSGGAKFPKKGSDTAPPDTLGAAGAENDLFSESPHVRNKNLKFPEKGQMRHLRHPEGDKIEQDKETATSGLVCPECGTELPPGTWVACPECGHELEINSSQKRVGRCILCGKKAVLNERSICCECETKGLSRRKDNNLQET